MSSRSSVSVSRPAKVGYCLILACVAVAVLCVATASASYYKMVLCAAHNGSGSYATQTNTVSGGNPGGIFSLENHCGPANFPAGNGAFLRIAENQASGNAGNTAYGSFSWSAPAYVSIAAGGGYTRQPNAFNQGWRGRFWAEGYDGSTNNILMQGSGVANGSLGGIGWATTPVFASHLWPFGGYGHYRRLVFEMTCVRAAGCDRANFNAVDANSLVLTLNDTEPSRAVLTNTGSGILSGAWVRGAHNVTWQVSERGSGIRVERVRVDGAERHVVDWRGSCDLGANGATGEFSRSFSPCPTGGPWGHAYGLDTSTLPDGAHLVQVCAQDYGQASGLAGSGAESCDQRTIRVDNSVPGAPGGLAIETENPNRYLDRIGAKWTLPADLGSPITKVHYEVVDGEGRTVIAPKTVSATNPTALPEIAAPSRAGNYQLRVWLEDAVGLRGPAATVAVPRDTTPPAAPQGVAVATPGTARSAQGFDVRWRNVTDSGSPITAAHYEVLDAAGNIAVGHREVRAHNPQAISELEAPRGGGNYRLRLWLSDAEGNVGAPSEAPLAYDCVRSDARGGRGLSGGFGRQLASLRTVGQSRGSRIWGLLWGPRGPVAGAAVCVFSRTITTAERQFIGLAMTGADGSYNFVLGAGPSREVTVAYRSGQRQIEASVELRTKVRPTLRLARKRIRNGQWATFFGRIPGPRNNKVVVVLQVKVGKGWKAIRRYRTRSNGRYKVRYRFRRTFRSTTYKFRTQVRQTLGYAYEQGNSRSVRLRVAR